MVNSWSDYPEFILTRFERSGEISKADNLETFGSFACNLLHYASGKTVTVSLKRIKGEGEASLSYHGTKPDLIQRICSIVFFILTLPVSLPLTIAGVIALCCSKSYSSVFQQLFNLDEEINKYQSLSLNECSLAHINLKLGFDDAVNITSELEEDNGKEEVFVTDVQAQSEMKTLPEWGETKGTLKDQELKDLLPKKGIKKTKHILQWAKENVDLCQLVTHADLKNISIDQEELEEFKNLCPNLSHLSIRLKDLYPYKMRKAGDVINWAKENTDLCQLVTLADLQQMENLTEEELKEFLKLFPNLTHLSIRSGKILKIEALPRGLQMFDCSWCGSLENLSLPSNLNTLDCTGCEKLKAIPDLPLKLQTLICKNCPELQELPVLPPDLQVLNCSRSDAIKKLPTLPSGLKKLVCSYLTKLQDLPEIPLTLQTLDCRWCHDLKAIPDLPPGLQTLKCFYCLELLKLPALPENLKKLDCGLCSNLRELPPLPSGLLFLDCRDCYKLESLPKLPSQLQTLYCLGNSLLPALPPLPQSLQTLSCSSCKKFTSLPPLPPGLLFLECTDIPLLQTLPPLPVGLHTLYCNSCPSLTTLPKLPPEMENFNWKKCPLDKASLQVVDTWKSTTKVILNYNGVYEY